jgi:hypothetical protein
MITYRTWNSFIIIRYLIYETSSESKLNVFVALQSFWHQRIFLKQVHSLRAYRSLAFRSFLVNEKTLS